MNFNSAKRLAAMKKIHSSINWSTVLVNNGAHDYCMKEETRVEGPWEFGTKPVQKNNKTDWEEVKKQAQSGNLNSIPADIYVQHYNSLRNIAKDNVLLPPDHHELRGYWIWGPSGSGKSRLARSSVPEGEAFYYKHPNKWWDSYKGEKYVICEDIDPSHSFMAHKFKVWGDRYGLTGEIKNSMVPLTYTHFIVTS